MRKIREFLYWSNTEIFENTIKHTLNQVIMVNFIYILEEYKNNKNFLNHQ